MPTIPFDAETVSRRFAPRVYFHPEENYLPSSVPWFLNRVCLYHITALHAKRVPRPYPVLDKGEVKADNLACQKRKGDDSSRKRRYGVFYLTIPKDRAEWKTRFGNLAKATCYCHVQPAKTPGRWWLAYCFFYPFNGSISQGIEITHEGDWELVKVEVDKTGTKMYRIYCAAHAKGGWFARETSPGNGFKCFSKTHPIVYSARDSHASYPTVGKQHRKGLPDDHTGQGLKMDCWQDPHLTLLGNKSMPSAGQDWLRFRGYWGHLGSGIPLIPDRGPLGPAYKSWWKDC
ncbi:MAG: Vps62-related protein [bacterium]|nr:Vps62-related protein [bacterium]